MRSIRLSEDFGSASIMPPPASAYVHVPFCAHRCGYCDFASVAGQDGRADEYLDALDAEMSAVFGLQTNGVIHNQPASVQTLFVGGGTPTYLTRAQLERFLQRLTHWFNPDDLYEFTVESNPNTLDDEKGRVLDDFGVNRVSLGAQSFQPHLLKQLERDHDPVSVGRAVEMLRARGIENISLDLIFGIPTQTCDEWEFDLERAIALQPTHLSAYGLTYEKGTRLWKQRQLNVVRPADEESERRMLDHTIDRMKEAGFAHYEISNYARNGAGQGSRAPNGDPDNSRLNRCQHNLTYWANLPYFGFGTGAAAYVAGNRTLNTRDLAAYITRCLSGRSAVTQSETLEPQARARETAILNLRRTDGLVRDEFYRQTGFSIDSLAGTAVSDFVELGLLVDDGTSIRLSRSGLPVADGILQSLL